MHSFRHSRSRILFEVFCALIISASCAGAWTQTGAWALLPAAGVAALYALVHTFDLAGRRSADAADPQRIDFVADQQSDRLIDQTAVVTLVADNPSPTLENAIEPAEIGEVASPEAKTSRRTKAPRKGGGRRASAPKAACITEPAPLVEAEIASIYAEATEADLPMATEEVAHPHIEALFEPEPYARMPRRAFGRKGG